MALTPFDMEGVNRDLLAAGNPAKPDMQSILRRNARDLVLGNAILVSSVDAKELEFGVHMAYSDADGGFDTDPSEDVWFEASSLPIPNERPDLPPDNALRIRVTDVLTEYGFTDIDVKAPDRTPEGIWIGFEAMQPVRLDVTSAQEGRSVSFTLTAAEANDWRSGRLDAHGLSRMAVERVLARPGDTVTLAYGDSLFRPAVMCDGSGRLPEHRVKAGIGTFVIGRESEAVMPEILRIDRTVDPRDPLVIEKAFGKENDMENGNVPEYWKGLMDEADLPLAGIVREHGGGLMDFHRMKGIERLTGSSDWDFYSWTVENYDDDLLDVCERENAADVLADLQAWWKTSQPDMRQHVDEMMAGIDATMEPLDKRLYAAAEKEFKERALDPDGECYQLDGGTFISQESFDGICGDQRDRYMAWKNQAEPARHWTDEIRDPEPLKRPIYNAADYDTRHGDPYYREHSTRADSLWRLYEESGTSITFDAFADESRQTDYRMETGALRDFFNGSQSVLSSYRNPMGGNPLIAFGVIGRWDGERTGISSFETFDDLMNGDDSPFKDCEIDHIWDENGILKMRGHHHDGSVEVEIRQDCPCDAPALVDLWKHRLRSRYAESSAD